MKASRLLIMLLFVVMVVLFFSFDLHHALTLESLKLRQMTIDAYREAHPVAAVLLYAVFYIAVTGLSLPGAAVLTLAGGAVFGLGWGTLIVSFASSLGATLAFVLARFLLRDWVASRFGRHLHAMDAGVARDGAFYLFTLRLVPVFPFFLINLAMGLTPIKTWTFYWVSQIGMLAGTLVYVNAGTQLARIDGLSGVISPPLLGSFALLGIFPLLAKKALAWLQTRQQYARFRKPRQFDNNLVVIGGGAGGLVSAYVAAAVKAKVTLIEQHEMGGDCLNRGCVPSKALIRTARFLSQIRAARELGIESVEARFDFHDVMERVGDIIRQVAPHDSAERYRALGVEVIQGTATLISPWEVQVSTDTDTRLLTTRSIIIAAGARPRLPSIEGLAGIDCLTSDNIWHLRDQPRHLLVLGAGPIGCELAQTFSRLGSRVTLLDEAARVLPREDPDVSEAVMARFKQEGIDMRLNHTAKAFIQGQDGNTLLAELAGQPVYLPFDRVLIAVGRQARVEGYGLEALGIRLSGHGTIETNRHQQTNYPNIYAVGDVAGPYQFTHTAAHQAWYAAVNALLGRFRRFSTDYSVIPYAYFTDPEVARVGLNEQDAREQGIAFEVTRYAIDELDRAIVDGVTDGFVKVLTPPGQDRILGVTLVGEHAGDLLAEFVLAMKQGIGLNRILATLHVYPTLAEANKQVAGVWRRNHAPEALLAWVARYHAFRRKA